MPSIRFEKENNRAAAYDENLVIGECTVSPSETLWIIDSTFVDPTYKGQKIGAKLVQAIVEASREANMKIIPLCPFAKREFEKNEAYHDVWSQ